MEEMEEIEDTQSQKFLSPEWFVNVQPPEDQMFLYHPGPTSKDLNWFMASWPNFDDPRDDRTAGRLGWTINREWAFNIWMWFYDGQWRGTSASEPEERLINRKIEMVFKNGRIGRTGPVMAYTDNQRILSFWITGGPKHKGQRRIDPTGADPESEIQLKRVLLYLNVYERLPVNLPQYSLPTRCTQRERAGAQPTSRASLSREKNWASKRPWCSPKMYQMKKRRRSKSFWTA